MAFLVCCRNGYGNLFGNFDFSADARAFAGLHHGPPIVVRVFREQQHFEIAARARVGSAQARRNDAGVVQHEDISGAQEIQNIAKLAMLDTARFAVQHEEARLIARRRRMLGNQFRRQIKIEIGGAHCPTTVTGMATADNVRCSPRERSEEKNCFAK